MFTVVTARKALQDLLAEKRVSWKDDDHFKQLTVAAGITSIGEEEIAAGMVVVDERGRIIVEDIEGRSFALGGDDPVIALAAERRRLVEECEAAGRRGLSDTKIEAIVVRTSKRVADLDERIADTIATSAAGIVDQVKILQKLGDLDSPFNASHINHSADCVDRLVAAITDGVTRPIGGAA